MGRSNIWWGSGWEFPQLRKDMNSQIQKAFQILEQWIKTNTIKIPIQDIFNFETPKIKTLKKTGEER